MNPSPDGVSPQDPSSGPNPRPAESISGPGRAPESPGPDEERAGIFGLETEYLVLFQADPPDRSSARQRIAGRAGLPPSERAEEPSFSLLEEVFFRVLLSRRQAANSSGLKGGYFLENGGLVHFEMCLREQADTPILEASSPECRSPWDVLVYARAFDRLLDEISAASREELESLGHPGRLVFAKNNRDPAGVGYGSHENALVYGMPTRAQRLGVLAAVPVLVVAFLPVFAALLLLLSTYAVGMFLARLAPRLGALGRLALGRLRRSALWPPLLYLYFVVSNALAWPLVLSYSRLVARPAYRPFIDGLSSFLVTRTILTGAGRLDFRHRVYELSQRSALTRSIAGVVLFGRYKTIFDLKSALYDPLSVLRPTRRLTIVCGDSTLSDTSTLLRLGPCALLIEMIEAGERFEELRLRRPLEAFRTLSREGPWKLLALRGGRGVAGGSLSAIEIQRRYLARAEAFFAERPEGRLRHREILSLWSDTLHRLAERPAQLVDTLDHAAKKSLLDEAILARSDWKRFFAWGHLFGHFPAAALREAASLAELLHRAPWWKRAGLRRLAVRLELPSGAFALHRDLYDQARKIDLRYHEISNGAGYQQSLERAGLFRRLCDDLDVERATREPPPDTRARVRSYYIRLSPNRNLVEANWNEVELQSPVRHIALPDPFFHQLPGDP